MTWRKASVPKKDTLMRAAVLADENEIPDNHVLTVRDRVLSTDLERVVQNNVKTDTVTLDLDGEWDDCTVYVTFNDETARSGPWSLEWEGQPLTIPSAIGAVVGPVAVSVVGYGSDGELRLVTEAAPSLLDVVKSGYVEIVDDNEENKDILSQVVAAGKKAEDAAEDADAAATSATSAASSANSAATSANSAATSANSAAAKANSAAVDAQNAYETLKPYMATIDSCANVLHREVGPDSVVTADDSFPCKPVEMTVYGQTRQNLWVNPSGTRNGLTVTANEDGSVTLSGTPTSLTQVSILSYALRPGSKYTVSKDVETTGVKFLIRSYDSGGSFLRNEVNADGWGNVETFTLHDDTACVYFGISVVAGQAVSGTYRVMLNEGSEPEPWCPPGLNSVNSVEVWQSGKNLLARMGTDLPYTSNGITFSDNGDSGIRISGTATATAYYNFFSVGYGTAPVIPAGTYTASLVGGIKGHINLGVGYYDYEIGGDFTNWLLSNATMPSSGSVDRHVYIRAYLSVRSGVVVDTVVYPQLELGSTATAYEPPAVTSTPVDLDGHTLNSLPDGARDELRIDGGGNVTMVQRVGSYVADGDEGWKLSASDAAPHRMCVESWKDDVLNELLPQSKFLSTVLPASDTSGYDNGSYVIINGGHQLYAGRTGITTADDFSSWLKTSPMTVLYPLAAPRTIDLGTVIPPTMAAPNVTAYVAGDTPAEMTLDYVRDVNIVHSRLEERVAALELASATS